MVARPNADPAAVVARADAPWSTMEDLVAEAKKRPEQVKLGDSGVGSTWHLAAAAMAEEAGASFLHVPYRTPEPVAEALAAIARGVAEEPSFREALARSNLGLAHAGAGAFDTAIAHDREIFRQPVARLNLT